MVATDIPSRVSIAVTDGQQSWTRDFFDYATGHSVPVYGFKPGHTNEITVTVHDRWRNQAAAAAPVEFITAPLPTNFPVITLLSSVPAKMEPGYTLFRGLDWAANIPYVTLVDYQGQVVWYSSSVYTPADVRQLGNGDLFMPLTTNFLEVNLLGETQQNWTVPNNLKIDLHDGVPTDHGTILYLNDDTAVVAGFPTSATDSNAPTQTASIAVNRAIEMSADNGSLLNNWSMIDLLDPLRITYLTFTSRTALGWDSEHANAIIEDPRDHSVIVSLRNQNAVIKFSRATGQLVWILGPPQNWGPAWQPYLLSPAGTPFVWNYGQHAPTITPQGTLLLYDDGNYRACPFDPPLADAANYSRAVEYAIDEPTMQVSQVWEYGRTESERLFTPSVGNAEWLPNRGNVLMAFGNATYINGEHPSPYSTNSAMVRIKEVTHETPPQVVFDLALFNYANTNSTYRGSYVYRAHRVPDLYGHLPRAVEDLTLTDTNGVAHLQFSGDPWRSYVVESSADLQHWLVLGAALTGGNGEYDLQDPAAGGSGGQYYRVITH